MFMSQLLEQGTDGTDDLPFGQDIDEQEVADHHDRGPSDHGIEGFTLPLAQFQELLAVSEEASYRPAARIIVQYFGEFHSCFRAKEHIPALFAPADVTEHPKGASDDRVNGATKSGSFSLLDGVNYWSFFIFFSFVVFVPWGQFFGER